MLNTEIKERTQKMTKGDHAIYDGNDTYEVGGKTYKVEKYIDVPECGSVPLLNLKMMSDERWNELATQNAIENYIKEGANRKPVAFFPDAGRTGERNVKTQRH